MDSTMSQFYLDEVSSWLEMNVKLPHLPISSVVTDSRKVVDHAFFIALKGQKVDGHMFLEEVAANGAVAALVSSDYQGPSYGLLLIHVKDVISALQKMAQKRLRKMGARVIGVTGSVGKTTTKEFIATLLSSRFIVGKSPGNANSQIGVPISILNSLEGIQILVLEMGMNAPGHIERLIEIATPEVAVITTIGHAHIEHFSNGLQGIANAKSAILDHPLTKWGVIGSQAHPFFPTFDKRGTCRKICIREAGEGDVFLMRKEGAFALSIHGNRSSFFSLPFNARHLVEDFACAAIVAHLLGISFEEITKEAMKLSLSKNRYEIIEKEGVFFLNDSYNASPESMYAALENLPKTEGKKIAVFSGMKELGSFSLRAHREVADCALGYIDHLFCFGEECMPMVDVFMQKKRPVEWFYDFSELKQRLYQVIAPLDVVLIKGSNSAGLWRIIE